jgi:hypothetical protein
MVGIAFGQAEWLSELKSGATLDIIASISLNEFRGQTSLQLMVEAIRHTNTEES